MNKPIVDKIEVKFYQEADNASESEEITITVKPVLIGLKNNNKDDFYFEIKTEEWRFDTLQDIEELIQQVKNMIK